MKTTNMMLVLSLAVCPALSAQQPAPANPAPTPPPSVVVVGQELQRARQLQEAAMEQRLAPLRLDSDPLERYLIPPEVIMRRQREINLQPAQRTQITQVIGRLEASLVDLQWTLQDQQQALAEMLQQPQVNTDAALQALDRILATETQVKRAHFQALLQIRNVLTAEQLDKLRPRSGWAEVRDDER